MSLLQILPSDKGTTKSSTAKRNPDIERVATWKVEGHKVYQSLSSWKWVKQLTPPSQIVLLPQTGVGDGWEEGCDITRLSK